MSGANVNARGISRARPKNTRAIVPQALALGFVPDACPHGQDKLVIHGRSK
jgi:hypothetical protein